MIMKDKLIKNHHKGSYYIVRNFALLLTFAFTFGIAIAVPTYIGYKQNNNETRAEDNQNSDKTHPENSLDSSEKDDSLFYC